MAPGTTEWQRKRNKGKERFYEFSKAGERGLSSDNSHNPLFLIYTAFKSYNGCQRNEQCGQGLNQQLEQTNKPYPEIVRKQGCVYLRGYPLS